MRKNLIILGIGLAVLLVASVGVMAYTAYNASRNTNTWQANEAHENRYQTYGAHMGGNGHMWGMGHDDHGREYRGRAAMTGEEVEIEGTVVSVNDDGVVEVETENGTTYTVMVRGMWHSEDGDETLWYTELLGLIQPGEHIEVEGYLMPSGVIGGVHEVVIDEGVFTHPCMG